MESEMSKPLLLIIDNDELICSSLTEYFADSGFSVIKACSGNEGIKALHAMRPDIVITDLYMPNGDGLEVLDAARQMDDNLPIIAFSGTGVLADAVMTLQRGAWDYLAKPVINLAELEHVVTCCLERARLVRENRNYQVNLEYLVSQRTADLRKLITVVEQGGCSVIITNIDGVIEYVNPKFTEITGYSSQEALGQNPRILKSGVHDAEYYSNLWETLRSGKEWKGELCNKAKDDTIFWELCSFAPVRDEAGVITSFVAIKEDITIRKQNETQLYHQANHDALTGLPNRYFAQKILSKQLEQMDSDSRNLSLMLLGIDNLKFVNDTFGHEFGDLLLKEFAERLQEACRNHCTVARFLGDEFIIIPQHACEEKDVVVRSEKICSAMNTVFMIEGIEVVSSASIGVVVYPYHGECAEKLLKNAGAALSKAKKLGKNKVAYYTSELNSQLERRFAMETRLRKALERQEFSLQYQPQISLDHNCVIGVEALLRWTPTGEAPVPPNQFIPLLEETGLIVEVGEWVLWQACKQAAEWQNQGLPPLRISVNISALQFIRSDLDATVKRVLAATGLEPSRLCLELTESMIMIDSDRTLSILAGLKEIGTILSLDDFGTGYSSLEYLGRLPIDELKIDRSFIQRMLTTRNDAVVVNTIIAMAQSLGMELVAEGVETGEQLNYLMEKKCSIIQGFYFSKPLKTDELQQYCSGHSFFHAIELP